MSLPWISMIFFYYLAISKFKSDFIVSRVFLPPLLPHPTPSLSFFNVVYYIINNALFFFFQTVLAAQVTTYLSQRKCAKQLYPEELRESTSGHNVINSTISWHDYKPCCTFFSGSFDLLSRVEWKTHTEEDSKGSWRWLYPNDSISLQLVFELLTSQPFSSRSSAK